MRENNIILWEDLVKRKQQKDQKADAKTYYQSLPEEKLKIEADHLLRQFNPSKLDDELFKKSVILMDEIAARVESKKLKESIFAFQREMTSRVDELKSYL